ncbi:MAG: hypothetical protein IMY76_07420 [Chloroflexi bacterium]|nr:hypothetical protein [Chloroflexota bacterium]
MKRIAFLLMLLVLSLSLAACSRDENGPMGPDAGVDNVPNLVGTYIVNGFDPLGTEYSGHLTIMAGEKSGAYDMQWIVVGSIQEGKGVVDGNMLKVTWYSITDIDESSEGTALYTITVNSELYGNRWVDGHDGEGIERAYPNQ